MSTKSTTANTPEVSPVDKFNAFWVAHRKTIYTSLIVLIVVVGATSFVYQSRANAKASAEGAFQSALAENLENPPALMVALETVANDYSGSESGAQAAFLIAEHALSTNNAEQALTWFNTTLESKKPGDFVYAEAFEGKGVALETLGQTEDAMKAYIKVLSLKEGAHRYPSVSLKLALLYKQKGNNEAALKQFKAITKYESTPVDILATAQKEIAVLN